MTGDKPTIKKRAKKSQKSVDPQVNSVDDTVEELTKHLVSRSILPISEKPKSKGGRPTSYTKEMGNAICEDLALGMSLRTVCKPDDRPSVKTIFNWFTAHPEFLQQYTRAKEEAADAMAEDILDIADDATNDWMAMNAEDDERYSLNGEHIQRSKLRIDTRKFLMAKMKPKRYGDKLDVTSGGEKLPTPLLGGLASHIIPSSEIIDVESSDQ